MSLRPEISGFSLETLRSLFGCRDRGRLKALHAECDEGLGGDASDPGENRSGAEKVKRIIERVVMKGAPFPDLDAEDETHVVAMILLAAHHQETLPTESNIWKAPILDDLWDAIGEELPAKVAPLYRGFQNGRPLLGKKIESSWSYYSCLTRQEVALLHQSLETIRRTHPDPTKNGFLKELTGWLRDIDRGARDLWFQAT
jgi:hypothetical protein